MLILDAAAVRQLLPLNACIPLMRDTMAALSAGQTQQMMRQILPVPDGVFGVMAGVTPQTYGSKLITAVQPRAGNGQQPSHKGIVLLFDPATGAPAALLDGTSLTAIRTAAASALATDVLARADAHRLAILGTGEQAHGHAHALCAVRPIDDIRVWGRTPAQAEALAGRLSDELHIYARATATVEQCVQGADMICTTTSAIEPLLDAGVVAAGTHPA